jgi:hypothetical protein
MSTQVKTASQAKESMLTRWIHRSGFKDEADFT